MSPKQDLVYSRGMSKSVAPSWRLIDMSDDEQDPKYVPLAPEPLHQPLEPLGAPQEGGTRRSHCLPI